MRTSPTFLSTLAQNGVTFLPFCSLLNRGGVSRQDPVVALHPLYSCPGVLWRHVDMASTLGYSSEVSHFQRFVGTEQGVPVQPVAFYGFGCQC